MTWKEERNRLIQAMVQAEGGEEAFVRAVRCSIPNCDDFDEALEIAINTIMHRLWEFAITDDGDMEDFIRYLGHYWAPIGAGNDPNNLNKNWVKNVISIYRSLTT